MSFTPNESNLCSLAALKEFLDPAPLSGVSSVAVSNGGIGYTSATATIVETMPRIHPGNVSVGTGATLSVQIASGVVTAINVTNGGHDYLAPSVVIAGDGTGATAVAVIGADSTLQRLITNASNTIVAATNRNPLFVPSTDITEKRNGNGRSHILPRVTPIVSVTSVTIGTQAIPLSDGTSNGYLFDSDTIYLIGYLFPRIPQYVTLIYKGGLAAGSVEAGMLEQACITTCALWWRRRPHIGQISEAMSQGMGTMTFSQADLPPEAWTIIKQIQRVAPVEY